MLFYLLPIPNSNLSFLNHLNLCCLSCQLVRSDGLITGLFTICIKPKSNLFQILTCLNLFRLSCQLDRSERLRTGVSYNIRIRADLKLSYLTCLNLFCLSCHLVQSEKPINVVPSSTHTRFKSFIFESPQSMLSLLPAGKI